MTRSRQAPASSASNRSMAASNSAIARRGTRNATLNTSSSESRTFGWAAVRQRPGGLQEQLLTALATPVKGVLDDLADVDLLSVTFFWGRLNRRPPWPP